MPAFRVAIVHNILTPYRTVLFDKLAARPEIDLHVYYCAESHQNRNWSVPEPEHNYTVLSGVDLGDSGAHFHINPSITYRLLQRDYDTVIVGGNTNLTMQLAYLISKFSSTETILWTERIREPNHSVGQFLTPVLESIARHASCLIVPTVQAREFQQARGLTPDRIVVGPNVVDNNKYWSDTTPEDRTTFSFLGQLIERKGVQSLIDAYSNIDEDQARLIIVGDGPDREKLKKLAQSRDLDINFTGWVNEQRKQKILATSDCFVLPSVEDLAPLAINEAMASSLPVITTEGVGNAPEMITEGANGYIVPVRDSAAIEDAMKMTLESTDELGEMGERSRRIVDERFSPAYTAKQFVTAIQIAQ